MNEVVPDSGRGLHAWDRNDVVMQQSCQYSTGSAGGNGSGFIDVDFSKIDYSNPKVADTDNKEVANSIEISPLSANDVNLLSLIAISSGIFGVRMVRKKRKNK